MKHVIVALIFFLNLLFFSCQREQAIIDYELDDDIFPIEEQWDIETVAPCGLGYDYSLNILEVNEQASLDPAIRVMEIRCKVENNGIGKGPDFYVHIQVSGFSSWWISSQLPLYPANSVQPIETIWFPTDMFDEPSIQVRLITDMCDVDRDNNTGTWYL